MNEGKKKNEGKCRKKKNDFTTNYFAFSFI